MSDLNNLSRPVTTDTEPDVLDTLRAHLIRAITWTGYSATTGKVAGMMSAITAAVSGGRSLRLYRRNDANAADEEIVTLPGISIAWSQIASGKPTTVAGYGITDAITTGNIGLQSVASATNATNATTVVGVAQICGYSLSTQDIGYPGAGGPQVTGLGNGAAMLTFHRPGAFAANFGIDTDNNWKVGGWSYGGGVKHTLIHSGNYTSYVAPPGSQVFTANGTFTVPAGVTSVLLSGAGGGGGGGGGAGGYGGGGGGGGASVINRSITGLTPGQTVTVTIGSGGAAGLGQNNGNTNGYAGGATSFGAYLSLSGGGGGTRGAANGVQGSAPPGDAGGAGGSAGGYGGAYGAGYYADGLGGAGGSCTFGGGGHINHRPNAGQNGASYGGGGAGGNGMAYNNGGAGAGGVLIVSW